MSVFSLRTTFSLVFLSLGLMCSASAVGQNQPAACDGVYAEESACELPCAFAGDCGPRWSMYAEAIALQRATTRGQALFIDGQDVETVLNARDISFPVAAGMRVGAIRHNDCGWDVELSYFQVDGFLATSNVFGGSNMVTDNTGVGVAVTDASARYRSALYNAELNVRRQVSDRIALLGGFRFAELDERYSATGSDGAVWMENNAFNHLYGLQIGTEAELYNRGGALTIKGVCKGGVFDNLVKCNSTRLADVGTGIESTVAARDQASFLGEAGVILNYAFTKRLAFRATGEAMWITGVGLAPMQIDSVSYRTGDAVANSGSTMFYYGGGLGLDYRF